MLEFLKQFLEADLSTIIVRAVLIVALTAVYFSLFVLAKKRNLQPYTYVFACVIVVLFAVSFFVASAEIAFYVYFALLSLIVLGFILLSQDISRSMFRLSVTRSKENSSEHFGKEELEKSVDEIVKACLRLSKTDTGALIIIGDHLSETILDSGIKVNADITAELLETLFFPKTALHDGAVVVSGNRVVAAGCYLPLAQSTNLPREFGTRHRAAIGVANAFPDLTAIVVSEETGIISAMHDTKIKRYLDAQQLQVILNYAMGLSDDSAEETIWGGQGK